MITISVKDRQSIVDIACQYYGAPECVIELCQDNGLELDSELQAGQKLSIREVYPESADSVVADYIKESGISIVGASNAWFVDLLATNQGAAILINENGGIEA